MVKELEQRTISKRSFGQAVIHECEKYWLSMPNDIRSALIYGELAPFIKGITMDKKQHEEWRRNLPYVHPFKWKPFLVWQSENDQFQLGDVSIYAPPQKNDPDYPKYLKKLDEVRRQHELIDSSLAEFHRNKQEDIFPEPSKQKELFDESPTNDQV